MSRIDQGYRAPATSRPGVITVNLAMGRGYSVLEVVRAFAAASGDIAQYYADPALAHRALG